MKKKIALLLTIVLIFTTCMALTGCGSKVKKDVWVLTYESDNGRENYYSEIEFAQDGLIASQKSGMNTFTYEYDENGLLLKETKTSDLYGSEITKYEYDENGLVIRQEINDEGSLLDGNANTYTYEFDDQGRVIKMTNTVEATGKVAGYTTYEYDDEGRIETATEHSSKVYVTRFHYDENGNVVKTFTTADGWTRERIYEYEDRGSYSYDADEMPLGEKYRDFRTNYRK